MACRKTYRAIFTLLLFGSVAAGGHAQEIDFGDYAVYSVSLGELGPQDLEFGLLIHNEGSRNIPLADAKVLTVTGVKYLDVIVSITADNELLLDGNPANIGDPARSIPFTLNAAYANRGQDNIGQARFFSVSGNSAQAQFQIRGRDSGPPGPPPTPPHTGYNPALYEESAYIYVFGSVNVGSVNSGSYSSQITVSVVYD